jgi:hypothetical protein
MRDIPLTESEAPTRAKYLKARDEPSVATEKTDREDPKRAILLIDTVEPT